MGHPLSRLNRSAAGDAEVTDEAQAESDLENRRAVLTNWSFWGSFGTCFVLSGFAESRYLISVAGFALIGVAFVSHLIINRVFGTSFRNGEITTAVSAFGIALLAFILRISYRPPKSAGIWAARCWCRQPRRSTSWWRRGSRRT